MAAFCLTSSACSTLTPPTMPPPPRGRTEHGDRPGPALHPRGASSPDQPARTIDHAEVRYLGYGEVDAYGMGWRVQATSGRITNSIVSHLSHGLYTFAISVLV